MKKAFLPPAAAAELVRKAEQLKQAAEQQVQV